MKTIILGQHIIKTDAFESITLHPDLPIILFCGGDLYHEDVLQVPMTFQNRFFAREAMERIDTGADIVYLSDIPCEWPWAASEQIIRYLFKTQKERRQYANVSQEISKDCNKQ